jgi:hypothetical protein
VIAFHAGAHLTHQAHLGEAIQRMKTVLSAATPFLGR